MAVRLQYPFWEVIEIAPGPNMDRIRSIMGNGTTATDFKNMLLRIGSRNIPGNDLPCEALALLPPATSIDYFYPQLVDGLMQRDYVVMDTQLRAPVGYMQILVPHELHFGVFTHDDFNGVHALAAYIGWNCSFTMSTVRPRAGQLRIRDFYAAQAGAYIFKLAKFMHHRIAEQLLGVLGRENIQYVLFYSIGSEEAREQHRKNGKRNTCTFLNEWHNVVGQTIPEFYNEPIANNTMFYLYMPKGADFVGSALYQALIVNGSDFSLPGALPPGHADYFKDANWACRNGPVEDENEEMDGGRRKMDAIRFLTKRRVAVSVKMDKARFSLEHRVAGRRKMDAIRFLTKRRVTKRQKATSKSQKYKIRKGGLKSKMALL